MQRFFRSATLCATAVLLASSVAFAAGSAEPHTIATVLQQSRDALGAAALQRGKLLEVNVNATVNGLRGTGTAVNEIGGIRFTERLLTPPIATGDGYDGKAFWNQDQSGLVWTDGSTAGVSREIDKAYAADDTLFTRGSGGATVAWAGERKAGNRNFAILIVTPPHSHVPMRVWIDAATHLPARYEIPVGAATYEEDLSDYRAVDGLQVAHRVVTSDGQGNSSVLTVRAARLGTASDAAVTRPVSTVNDFSIVGGSRQISVPIDIVDRHVYLNVMLDGKGPYRFVFDTGGSNVIDPAVAKEIKTGTSGSAQDNGTGSGTVSLSYTTVDSLKIGNATLRHQVFSVEPLRKGFGVDGLIGFEVLARYVTTIDYGHRTVTLSMPRAATTSRGRLLHFALWGTLPQIGCSVDGIASQCTVDTGDAGSVQFFVPFTGNHPNVVPAKHSALGVNGYGVGGGHRGFMGRLRSLQVGGYTLNGLVAGYATQNAGDFASPFLAANLGGGVWDRFTVTLDYRNQEIELQPNAHFAERDSYDRAGMVVIDKAGKVVVYSVRRQTPAAKAGFLKGDVILSIDGIAQRSAAQARRAFRAAPGTVLHVEVTGKDRVTRTLTVTLRDWV